MTCSKDWEREREREIGDRFWKCEVGRVRKEGVVREEGGARMAGKEENDAILIWESGEQWRNDNIGSVMLISFLYVLLLFQLEWVLGTGVFCCHFFTASEISDAFQTEPQRDIPNFGNQIFFFFLGGLFLRLMRTILILFIFYGIWDLF